MELQIKKVFFSTDEVRLACSKLDEILTLQEEEFNHTELKKIDELNLIRCPLIWDPFFLRFPLNHRIGHHLIKYAYSKDGFSWIRDGKIAIPFKNENEYALSRPFVLYEDNRFKMWYSFRGKSYRIGYAESKDGQLWERQDHLINLTISSTGWDSESIEYPYIFDHKGSRFMLYNGNGYGKTGFGLAKLE